MSTISSAQAPLGHRPIRATGFRREGISSLEDDRLLAKLHSVAIQAALSVLLSLFGLGSAMAQSTDRDMTLAANTQATRDRVISEISQARADGTIKRWSPVLIEVPFKAPLKGSRFEPFATHQADGDSNQYVPRDDRSGITGAAAR